MCVRKRFVGREYELKQFEEVLLNPRGQAVLVVGQAGMGKTWLVNRMAEVAAGHAPPKCGWVRYEVTPRDSADSTMALMMDNAFEAAQLEVRSFVGTKRRLEQWRGLLNVINIGDLVMSLRQDAQPDTREQFVERLELISKWMPANRRAIFVIDPEKYMHESDDQSWAIVVRQLPEKIKFVFAQRPEDVLVDSEAFGALENVVRIPDEELDVLGKEDVHELLIRCSGDLKCERAELDEALRQYKGHPYALGASLHLIEAGTPLGDLPSRPEPTKFAEVQWKRVCRAGEAAVKLFEAYAILDIGVPDEMVEAVSELGAAKRKALQNDRYLNGLLREEGYGKRIYHAILGDHILWQVDERGVVTETSVRRIEQLLRSENRELFGWLFDRTLGSVEERIRKERYRNLVRDYVSLGTVFAGSEGGGSVQRAYRYQSIGRVLKDLGRMEEGRKHYLEAAGEYNVQAAARRDKFWRSESWFQAGWCYEHAAEWEKAATCYQKGRAELRTSRVQSKNLLEAELLRCEGECLGRKLNEECMRGKKALGDRVKNVLVEAENMFESEVGAGWICVDILEKLGQMSAYSSEERSVWGDKAEKLKRLMILRKRDCTHGAALFLYNLHDLYLADKLREVFLGHGIWAELKASKEFAQNKESIARSGDWNYIVCLGGPVSKDGLFDWRFEVFGECTNFCQLLQRSAGYFGCWLSTYGESKAILVAGVGKYRTFLGIRDMITESRLHRIIEENSSNRLIWQDYYESHDGA